MGRKRRCTLVSFTQEYLQIWNCLFLKISWTSSSINVTTILGNNHNLFPYLYTEFMLKNLDNFAIWKSKSFLRYLCVKMSYCAPSEENYIRKKCRCPAILAIKRSSRASQHQQKLRPLKDNRKVFFYRMVHLVSSS